MLTLDVQFQIIIPVSMTGRISGRVLLQILNCLLQWGTHHVSKEVFFKKKCLIDLFGHQKVGVVMIPLVSISSIFSYFPQLFYPAVYQQLIQV